MSNNKFTSFEKPQVEVQTEEGIARYITKINNYSLDDIIIEFSNIRTAKYIRLSMGGLICATEHEIMPDLNDKAYLILMRVFGTDKIKNFLNNDCKGDMRTFNKLVDALEVEVFKKNLETLEHSKELLRAVATCLGIRIKLD